MIKDIDSARIYLEKILNEVCEEFPEWLPIALFPLSVEAFHSAPASTKGHHWYKGGLLVHTAQVTKLSMAYVSGLDVGGMPNKLNRLIMALAAVWHDFGKILTYAPVLNKTGTGFVYEQTTRTPLDMEIGHIVLSRDAFIEQASKARLPEESAKIVNTISHLILAHHGTREWGSPVLPQTALAMMLHQADNLSAKYYGGEDGAYFGILK